MTQSSSLSGRSRTLQRKPSRQGRAGLPQEVCRVHRENPARESQRNKRLRRNSPIEAVDRQA